MNMVRHPIGKRVFWFGLTLGNALQLQLALLVGEYFHGFTPEFFQN